MTQPDPPTLDYATPLPRKRGVGITPYVAGAVAGPATFARLFAGGAWVMGASSLFFGLTLGFVCAGTAPWRMFWASAVVSAIAAASLFASAMIWLAVGGGGTAVPASRDGLALTTLAATVFAALLAAAALFGSFCVWVGRDAMRTTTEAPEGERRDPSR